MLPRAAFARGCLGKEQARGREPEGAAKETIGLAGNPVESGGRLVSEERLLPKDPRACRQGGSLVGGLGVFWRDNNRSELKGKD